MAFPFLSVSFSHLLCVSGLNHNEILTAPRFGGGGFNCRGEEHSQRHQEGSRAERENNRLNRASRLNWAERRWGGGERGGPRETRAMWQGDRKQKLGVVGAKPLN